MADVDIRKRKPEKKKNPELGSYTGKIIQLATDF